MIKTPKWLIIYALAVLMVSCNVRNENNNFVKKGTFGESSIEEINNFVGKKESFLRKGNSQELNDIAVEIYFYVGSPSTVSDTTKLNVAIEYLDKALELKKDNKVAYYNKVDILSEMKMWGSGIQTIDSWLDNEKAHYYDYMLKGFIYEMKDERDSSVLYFEKALNTFNSSDYPEDDVRNRIHEVAITAFLYGEEAALKVVNKLIDITNSESAKLMRDYGIKNFDRKRYITSNVFLEPQEVIVEKE